MHPNRYHSPYTPRRSLRGVSRSANYLISLALDTGADMKDKYKETALGGLAVNVIEC